MVYTSELICIFQLHSRRDGKRENFAEKGVASRQVVWERWSRVLKVRLLEGEQEAASTWRHRKSLLGHVASLGVTDRREIRSAEVATHKCCRSGESRFNTLRSPQKFNFRIKTFGI